MSGANPRTVFILGGSADIGRALAERYLAADCSVALTYRARKSVADLEGRPNLAMIECDVGSSSSIEKAVREFGKLGWKWDLFLSSVGTMEPIGPFFDTDFSEWERSVDINALGQLHVLHGLYPFRRTGKVSDVMFFAGGGTNNPFTNYSAYAASKILLIKMAELLDDEASDINIFVVGPGYVRTKIHEETLRNAKRAGSNLEKTQNFLKGEGTSYDDIFGCIEWCAAQGRPVAGGRNFSVVHDPWRNGGAALAASLANENDLYKLRRRQTLPADTGSR